MVYIPLYESLRYGMLGDVCVEPEKWRHLKERTKMTAEFIVGQMQLTNLQKVYLFCLSYN